MDPRRISLILTGIRLIPAVVSHKALLFVVSFLLRNCCHLHTFVVMTQYQLSSSSAVCDVLQKSILFTFAGNCDKSSINDLCYSYILV